MPVVALVTDLIFATKIKSTADALQVPLRVVRSADALLTAAAENDLLLVDMNASGVDGAQAIALLRERGHKTRVIAYLSHVQQELAEAAREAGADDVMPRSKFSAQLPDLLRPYVRTQRS